MQQQYVAVSGFNTLLGIEMIRTTARIDVGDKQGVGSAEGYWIRGIYSSDASIRCTLFLVRQQQVSEEVWEGKRRGVEWLEK